MSKNILFLGDKSVKHDLNERNLSSIGKCFAINGWLSGISHL